MNELLTRWNVTGLLVGLPDDVAVKMAMLFERQARYELSERSDHARDDLMLLLPVIRRVFSRVRFDVITDREALALWSATIPTDVRMPIRGTLSLDEEVEWTSNAADAIIMALPKLDCIEMSDVPLAVNADGEVSVGLVLPRA